MKNDSADQYLLHCMSKNVYIKVSRNSFQLHFRRVLLLFVFKYLIFRPASEPKLNKTYKIEVSN